MHLPLLVAAVWALSCANSAFAAGPFSTVDAIRSFEVAEGLEVELVASEPSVESPCAMAFDEKGQLYIAENRGYPRGPQDGESPAGRIALLRDRDGDGRMDERVTFADGLTFPNGVLPWRDGLIVTCAPDVLFLRDTDGDGRADERRVLLTGFDTAKSTQLRVNAPTVGPDGWIWLAAGLSGGKVTNPAHPEFGSLDLKSDLRFQPDTGRFEAVDGRSQYGQSFDEFGQRFICMNRIQVQHVVMPSAALKRNPLLAFSDSVQNCPELIPNGLLRGGGGAARIFPISSNITTADSHAGTFSAACAVTVFSGTAYSCDPTGNLVHADRLVPNGATFAAVSKYDGREFLASRDDWFRPVFLSGGPDGALYVCDMYRKVIEHPDYLPEEVRKHTDFEAGMDMGRIWRVQRKKSATSHSLPAAIDSQEALKSALDSDHAWLRQTAYRLLVQGTAHLTPEEIAGATKAAKSAGGKAALLMLAAQAGALMDEQAADALSSAQPELRALAVRLVPDRAKAEVDAEASVRFATALALGVRENRKDTVPVLAQIALLDGADRWSRAAVLSSAAGLEEKLIGELVRAGNSPDLTLLRELGRILGRKQTTSGTASVETLLDRLATRPQLAIAIAAGWADSAGGLPKGSAFAGVMQHAVDLAACDRPTPERQLAIELLGHATFSLGGEALLKVLQSGAIDVQVAAIRALAKMGDPAASAVLLDHDRWEKFAPSLREAALGGLGTRPDGIRALLAAVDAKAVPLTAIDPLRRQQWMRHPDQAIRETAVTIFRDPQDGNDQQALDEAKHALTLVPKPANGRQVFSRLCASCHRFDREGHAVGPDLLDIRNQPKESILLHIVVPDHEIAPGFTAYSVDLKDGRALAGVIASETSESVTLRQPGGVEENISRSSIATLTALPSSLMPKGLDRAMTQQELADLLSYLRGEQ